LASCTFSVLHSWASNAGVGWEDLSIAVKWAFAERPHRVGSMDVELKWPSLPEDRTDVALRASQLCAVHATLSHSPEIRITREGTPTSSAPATVPGMPASAPAQQIDESTSGP
nr:OsmC family protein [Gemmatimonadaceae bacterium]